MTERKKSTQKKENQYQYQLPQPLSVPSPLPPSHTQKAAQGGHFRASLGKTLGGVRPVQTPAGRAAGAHTLVMHTPSRQALTGLPGTSHDRFILGGSIEHAAVSFVEKLAHHFGCEWSDHHSVLSVTCDGFNTSKPPDTVGELFVADVLKRFHNDGSFHEVNQ